MDGSGSAWDLISKGCRHYGVNAKTIKEDEDTFKERLDEGNLIVVNLSLIHIYKSFVSCLGILAKNIVMAIVLYIAGIVTFAKRDILRDVYKRQQ